MNILALIPAKGESSRLPSKNTRPFMGLPLFLHSVYYARQEGVEPIVSTDSEAVRALCKQHGVRCLAEQPAPGGDMNACIRSFFEKTQAEAVALLQPTSPLRAPGMLRCAVRYLEEGEQSVFSCALVKPQGMMQGAFLQAGRDQDTAEWFKVFDGSIAACTAAHFREHASLFSAASRPLPSPTPCSMQIDTAVDFIALEAIARQPAFSTYCRTRPGLRVCVVCNAPESELDHAATVDAMDVVIRVNSMQNLEKGFAGSKTDLALITAGPLYFSIRTAEERHESLLPKLPAIFFTYPCAAADEYAERLGLTRWSYAPCSINDTRAVSTTAGRAVLLALHLFPACELHMLGDLSPAIRTDHNPLHSQSNEAAFLSKMVELNHLTLLPTHA